VKTIVRLWEDVHSHYLAFSATCDERIQFAVYWCCIVCIQCHCAMFTLLLMNESMNESNYERRTSVTKSEISFNWECILRKVFETLLVIINLNWRSSSPYLRNEKSIRRFWAKFILKVYPFMLSPTTFLYQCHKINSMWSHKNTLALYQSDTYPMTESRRFRNKNGPTTCHCIFLLIVTGLSRWTRWRSD